MAVQIFGRGVDHEVGAQCERPLKYRREESIVHDEERAGLA